MPDSVGAVETTMYRALAVLRFVVLVNMISLNIFRWDNVDRPLLGALVIGGLTVWTAFTVWGYDSPARRGAPLLVADLVISVAAILVSPIVKGADMQATIPGFWVMGVVLAWGIHWNLVGGLLASVAVTAADLSVRFDLDQGNYGNIFLLMIGGPILGYTSGLLKEMAAARDRAERSAAAAAERARLSRAVHDGVLQVLALVQRRGIELGGEAAELGRLAGDQEVALRALVQDEQAPLTSVAHDLSRSLTGLATRNVSVSTPGPVRLPSWKVDELTSVVHACLDNVTRHVGPDARAWVLVEDLGASVVVTVRDEGPGIADGRLEQARAEGRMGVADSIRGRMADLGGTAALTTAPGQGTEWELTVSST